MGVISIEELRVALRRVLAPKGISSNESDKLAERIMDLFGFSDQVVDNRLTPEDRDIFYMLEENGLVTTIEDDVQVQKGKTWRIYYWILKEDQIRRLAHETKDRGGESPVEADIYKTMSDDVWKHHEGNA